jgi:hypothetical protein
MKGSSNVASPVRCTAVVVAEGAGAATAAGEEHPATPTVTGATTTAAAQRMRAP